MTAEGVPILAPVDEQPPARRRRLARSTAIFSLATGLSRILGLVREIVARYYFGTVGAINAFEVAFLIPNTVRALVADAALSSAFVPVFSELLEKGERKRAWRVASSLFWLVLLGLGGLTALFIVIAPWIMAAFGYGHLAVGLSRVLFPIVVLLGLSGIVVGILNSYDHFTVPALTPVFWNIAIIVGLVIGVPRANGISAELYVYAFSILIATVIQFLLPLPWLRGRDGRLQVVIDWRDPAVRQTLVLMVPITIGLGLINFNAVVDTFFAARLIDRFQAPSAINAAFRLYMLPQGMFSVAVATVLFPSLARLASRGRHRRLPQDGDDRDPADRVPARAGERRSARCSPSRSCASSTSAATSRRRQTPVVAASLAAFSLGLVFNGFMLMLNRAFFSLQSPWIPTWVALGNLGLNAVLDAAFYRFGIWGIPLSTSLVNIAGTAALFVLLRRRLGRLDLRESASAFVRIVAASAVAGAVAYGVWCGLDEVLGRGLAGQIVSVGTSRSPPRPRTGSRAACSGCASCRRCSRCAAEPSDRFRPLEDPTCRRSRRGCAQSTSPSGGATRSRSRSRNAATRSKGGAMSSTT